MYCRARFIAVKTKTAPLCCNHYYITFKSMETLSASSETAWESVDVWYYGVGVTQLERIKIYRPYVFDHCFVNEGSTAAVCCSSVIFVRTAVGVLVDEYVSTLCAGRYRHFRHWFLGSTALSLARKLRLYISCSTDKRKNPEIVEVLKTSGMPIYVTTHHSHARSFTIIMRIWVIRRAANK